MNLCLPRTARPLALLLCGLLALPVPAALAQSAGFTSAVSGTTRPLTLKVKDLDSTWRQLSISKVGGADLLSLFTAGARGAAPTLDQYYTHGETTVIGGETYLVAYRYALKLSDLTRDNSNTPPQITPETTLTLSLINVRQIASLDGIQPYVPVSAAQAQVQTSEASKQASLSNLKQIGLGIAQYVQDYDEMYPPMQSTAIAKAAIYPYIKSEAVFQNPTTHEPYRPNTSLSHHSLAEIDNPSVFVVYTEDGPNPDGTRGVLFADGHAAFVSDAESRRLLAASHLPAPKR